MRYLRPLILALCLAAPLIGPGAAVAASCGGSSAGDQQYCDPLGNCSSNCPTSGSSHHSGSSNSGATGSGASGSNASAASGSTPVSSTTTTTTSSTTSNGGKTLPYTGLDVGLAAVLGLGLVGGGFLIRRRALRS